jgi:hypothetical protein
MPQDLPERSDRYFGFSDQDVGGACEFLASLHETLRRLARLLSPAPYLRWERRTVVEVRADAVGHVLLAPPAQRRTDPDKVRGGVGSQYFPEHFGHSPSRCSRQNRKSRARSSVLRVCGRWQSRWEGRPRPKRTVSPVWNIREHFGHVFPPWSIPLPSRRSVPRPAAQHRRKYSCGAALVRVVAFG